MLANEILNRGIKTILVTTDGESLSSQWCGRLYSRSLLTELPAHIDPCGENGEFHTLVVNAPCFREEILLTLLDKESDGRFTYQRYRMR